METKHFISIETQQKRTMEIMYVFNSIATIILETVSSSGNFVSYPRNE